MNHGYKHCVTEDDAFRMANVKCKMAPAGHRNLAVKNFGIAAAMKTAGIL